MPYATNADLPPGVRLHLPVGAQTLYRQAFNGAWQRYSDDPRREEIVHRIAWTAVKRRYVKAGSMWRPRDSRSDGRFG